MSSLKKRFPGEPCLAVARSVWGREAVDGREGWAEEVGCARARAAAAASLTGAG